MFVLRIHVSLADDKIKYEYNCNCMFIFRYYEAIGDPICKCTI